MQGARRVEALVQKICNRLTSSPVAVTHESFVVLRSGHGDDWGPMAGASATAKGFTDLRGLGRMWMSAQAVQEEEKEVLTGGVEVQRLYKQLIETLGKKRMPEASKLPSLLQSCASPADVKLAFDATERLRDLKAVQGQQKANFNRRMVQLMVEACIRSGDAHSALKTLWKKNPYGFTPAVYQAHLLLKHAREQKDLKLMLQVLKTMVTNDVRPVPATADIILRTCKEAGDMELLLRLAKELHINGVQFDETLFDIIISCAANSGDVKEVHEVQKWREWRGLNHTVPSAIALAKASVLEGNPKEAAQVIFDNCTDLEKRARYLSLMIQVWPLQLSAKLDESPKEKFLEELKEKLLVMADTLHELGSTLPLNANEQFAKGKQGHSKAA